MVGVEVGVPEGRNRYGEDPSIAATAFAPFSISTVAAAADSRGSVWCDQVWLPRSWPAATMSRPSSGWSVSHVPTAKTVTWAPWSVSATAGTDELPCRMSSPGVRSTAGTDCACAGELVGADVSGPGAEDGAGAAGLPAVAGEEGAGPSTSEPFVEQAARPRPTAEARPPISARRPTTGDSSDTRASWPNALKIGWDHAVRPRARASQDGRGNVPTGAEEGSRPQAAGTRAWVEPQVAGAVPSDQVGSAVTVEVPHCCDHGQPVVDSPHLHRRCEAAGSVARVEPEVSGCSFPREEVRAAVAVEVTGSDESVHNVPPTSDEHCCPPPSGAGPGVQVQVAVTRAPREEVRPLVPVEVAEAHYGVEDVPAAPDDDRWQVPAAPAVPLVEQQFSGRRGPGDDVQSSVTADVAGGVDDVEDAPAPADLQAESEGTQPGAGVQPQRAGAPAREDVVAPVAVEVPGAVRERGCGHRECGEGVGAAGAVVVAGRVPPLCEIDLSTREARLRAAVERLGRVV